MHIPSPRVKRRARIEIIPLIDIIFFLLATFIMVSLSMVKNQGINVHLPAAATSTSQDQNDSVSITITDSGTYYWNKELLPSPDELTSRLQQWKASHPDPKIFINGDGKASFENIVKVLDDIRKLGITKIAIETSKK